MAARARARRFEKHDIVKGQVAQVDPVTCPIPVRHDQLDLVPNLGFQAPEHRLQQRDEPLVLQVELGVGGVRCTQAVAQEGKSFAIDVKGVCLLWLMRLGRLVGNCGVGYRRPSDLVVAFTREDAW